MEFKYGEKEIEIGQFHLLRLLVDYFVARKKNFALISFFVESIEKK